MKKLLLLSALLILISACIEENPVETYKGSEDIYFPVVYPDGQYDNGDPNNFEISFAFFPDKTDSLLTIPVRATGRPADHARKYNVQLTDSSTAEEGKDFDYFEEDFTIPAGELRDNIQIMLHKTPELKEDTLALAFELEPNENFDTNLKYRQTGVAGSDSITVLKFDVFFNDVVSRPNSWLDRYMGPFSPKKLYLTTEITGLDITRWGIPPGAENSLTFRNLGYYATTMQRYLDKQAAKGDTVYTEDGTPMVMGPSAD